MATDMTCTYRPCEPHLAETPAMFPSGHQDAGLVEIPSISPRGSESLAYTVVPRTSARVRTLASTSFPPGFVAAK